MTAHEEWYATLYSGWVHGPGDCFEACGSRSGPCNECGKNNLCCRPEITMEHTREDSGAELCVEAERKGEIFFSDEQNSIFTSSDPQYHVCVEKIDVSLTSESKRRLDSSSAQDNDVADPDALVTDQIY